MAKLFLCATFEPAFSQLRPWIIRFFCSYSIRWLRALYSLWPSPEINIWANRQSSTNLFMYSVYKLINFLRVLLLVFSKSCSGCFAHSKAVVFLLGNPFSQSFVCAGFLQKNIRFWPSNWQVLLTHHSKAGFLFGVEITSVFEWVFVCLH